MVSIWWVVWMFVLGGFAGMLVLALAHIAARESERSAQAEDAVERGRLAPVNLEEHWST